MANYTDDEIEAVTDQLVNSTISRPYDTLGVRRTDVTFTDIQQAAAGVFLMYPKTPFYFAFLGTSRLEDQVAAAGDQVAALSALIDVLRRRVVPVKDVSSLANARAALGDLESAVAAAGPPRDITKVPAFQRFNANIDRFLGQVGSNIKDGGQVVPTPSDARGQIPAAVVALQAQMADLVVNVTNVSNAMADYGTINLPSLVSGSVISNARTMLDSRVTQLEAMTEVQRLDVLRQTVLEALGTKAMVAQFGSFVPPSDLADIQGVGTAYTDSSRPGLPAALDGEKYGPYVLVAGTTADTSTNVLSLWADGAASYPAAPTTQFFLPTSIAASLSGTAAGPFNIVLGTNDAMQVDINGVSYNFALTDGGTQAAADVAADITAGLTSTNYKGETYFAPLMFDGEVQVSGNDLTLAFGTFPANSVNIGDEVDFYYGPDAPATRTVTGVSPSTSNPQTITVDGGALTGPTDRIQYGSANRRVRIVAIDKALAVQNRDVLQLRTPTDIEAEAGITLGMFGELISYSSPTDAQVVVNYVTANSKSFAGSVLFNVLWGGITLRSDPSSAFLMVLYYHRGNATWASGTTVTVTLADVPVVTLTGQTLVLREGMNPGVIGTVNSQDDTDPRILNVTFASAVTGATALVEVGPATGLSPGMAVQVTTGPNQGKFYIDTVDGTVPFQFKCRSTLPVSKDNFTDPVLFTGDVGSEGVTFLSKLTTTASEVECYDPLTVFFNTTGPHHEFGTTTYLKLPSLPSDVEPGDFVEFFETDLEDEDYDRTILTVSDDAVVQLDDTITSVGSWTFGGATVPVALLRTDKVVSFDDYSAKLKTWLQSDAANVTAFFTDLNRFIQPLLANDNPTDSDIGSALNKLAALLAGLTIDGSNETSANPDLSLEAILDTYSAPFVPEADALIKAFTEKGADRAVDTLLDCQFAEFFGFDQDDVSYAGSLQKNVRAVATNDLPVRKTDRTTSVQSPLSGSSESPDYETDSSDLDTSPNIDPPVNGIG